MRHRTPVCAWADVVSSWASAMLLLEWPEQTADRCQATGRDLLGDKRREPGREPGRDAQRKPVRNEEDVPAAVSVAEQIIITIKKKHYLRRSAGLMSVLSILRCNLCSVQQILYCTNTQWGYSDAHWYTGLCCCFDPSLFDLFIFYKLDIRIFIITLTIL